MTHHILRVDLTQGTCRREEVPAELVRQFLGGKGLAAHYLASELPPGCDPFSPENRLIFMTGPLSGLFPGTCRHVVVTRSPATGGFLDTYAGGYFAWELRKCGLLGIIIQGQAPALSYLEVTATDARLQDARPLAGKSIAETDDFFPEARVAAIGPAGENRVLFACIGNNAGRSKNGRSGYNGRGGAGAVMGQKNLKCIVLRGEEGPTLSAEARELRRRLSQKIQAADSASGWLREAGTPVIVDWTNQVQVLPTENWHRGSFPEAAARIGHEPVLAHLLSREACYRCPVACGPHVRAETGAFPGAEADKLEYETIGLGASNTGNGDFSSIVHFAQLCDELGLDTISCGAAVAFLMDAAAQGFVDSPVRFGDAQGQAALTRDIAYRQGLGAVLADGIERAARAWGVDEEKVPVFSIKHLEFPAYDPRGSVGMALAYATSDRGACHMRSWPIAIEALSAEPDADPFGTAGKAAFVIAEQDENCREWSLVGCDFIAYQPEDALAMLQAVGLDLSAAEYERLGKRIWNLVRLFNLKQGWTDQDDRLPRALHLPLEDSGRALSPETFLAMKREYYALRGWDEAGRPTPELIAALDLERYA